MGNSASTLQEKINTKTMLSTLTLATLGVLGSVYLYKKSSGASPKKSDAARRDTPRAHSLVEAEPSATRRHTVLFEKNELVDTDGWLDFEEPSLGLKFKHPPNISCKVDLQESLTVISFSEQNASERVLRFMTIEFQAERVDPKEYASKALNSIRQMIPNVNEKKNRLFDFNGYDAFELQYEMNMEGKQTQVWNLSIAADHVNYLFQCMNGAAKDDAIRLTKTIVDTLKLSDVPPNGSIQVKTPSSLQLNLPSPYLSLTDLNLLNKSQDILKASFATPEEPCVEQIHITKSHDALSIHDLLAHLKNQYGPDAVSDRGELDLPSDPQIKGNIVQWCDDDFEYIAFIFVHNNIGYTVKCQIEESRLSPDFQKRVIDSFQSIHFISNPPQKLEARYVHKEFSIKAPLGTPLRELPPPLVVQFFHSNQETNPIHTNVEFKQLRLPIESIEKFNDELRKQYESPEMSHMNEVQSQKIITVNGKKAVRLVISSVFAPDPMAMMMQQINEPDYLITMQTSFLKDSENVLSVTSVALKDEYDRNKQMFEDIHESLVILE